MPIIRIRDNENNRWNRNANKKTKQNKNKQTNKQKNKQRQKRASGTEAIVKWCGLNNFVVHLS